MALASWIVPDKLSGSGNATVNVSASGPHTGRVARSGNMTVSAAGADDVVVAVNQAGATEFVTMQGTAAVTKAGGNIQITGSSNSSVLTFSKANDNIGIVLPANYIAASQQTANGAAIAGDPGAAASFDFALPLSVPANQDVDAKTCQIIVTDNAGNTQTCLLTLAAGDAQLSVSPLSVDLPADGSTSAVVNVTCNTSWSIS